MPTSAIGVDGTQAARSTLEQVRKSRESCAGELTRDDNAGMLSIRKRVTSFRVSMQTKILNFGVNFFESTLPIGKNETP